MKRYFILISLLSLIVILVRFIRDFQYAMLTLYTSERDLQRDYFGSNGNTALTSPSTEFVSALTSPPSKPLKKISVWVREKS